MRKISDLLRFSMTKKEKEWDSRLFVDAAVKSSVEYHLQTLALALSGPHKITWEQGEQGSPLERQLNVEGDGGVWAVKTEKFLLSARMNGFVFYGNNHTQIYLQIIDFWAGKETVFPCGAATAVGQTTDNQTEDDKNSYDY